MNSREKFILTATELFAKYGYNGVSVRDIAKTLDMRESAMYKHFSSKAELFNAIIELAKDKLNQFQKSIEIDNKSVKNTLINTQLGLFDLYTLDPFMSRFRKIMIISQYENNESNEQYQEMFIGKSITYYQKVINEIARSKGLNINARLIAYELFAVPFLVLQQSDCQSDKTKLEESKNIIRDHVNTFFERYCFIEEEQNDI